MASPAENFHSNQKHPLPSARTATQTPSLLTLSQVGDGALLPQKLETEFARQPQREHVVGERAEMTADMSYTASYWRYTAWSGSPYTEQGKQIQMEKCLLNAPLCAIPKQLLS